MIGWAKHVCPCFLPAGCRVQKTSVDAVRVCGVDAPIFPTRTSKGRAWDLQAWRQHVRMGHGLLQTSGGTCPFLCGGDGVKLPTPKKPECILGFLPVNGRDWFDHFPRDEMYRCGHGENMPVCLCLGRRQYLCVRTMERANSNQKFKTSSRRKHRR